MSLGFGRGMDGDQNQATFARLERTSRDDLPGAEGREAHPPLGRAGVDPGRHDAGASATWAIERVVYSVGCMGHGVSITHLNGRTLADLAAEREDRAHRVFFVNRQIVPWPPEPLRFLAARAALGAAGLQDRWDERRG